MWPDHIPQKLHSPAVKNVTNKDYIIAECEIWDYLCHAIPRRSMNEIEPLTLPANADGHGRNGWPIFKRWMKFELKINFAWYECVRFEGDTQPTDGFLWQLKMI